MPPARSNHAHNLIGVVDGIDLAGLLVFFDNPTIVFGIKRFEQVNRIVFHLQHTQHQGQLVATVTVFNNAEQ